MQYIDCVQARYSPIKFDYLGYFFLRFDEYKRRKEELLSLTSEYLNSRKQWNILFLRFHSIDLFPRFIISPHKNWWLGSPSTEVRSIVWEVIQLFCAKKSWIIDWWARWWSAVPYYLNHSTKFSWIVIQSEFQCNGLNPLMNWKPFFEAFWIWHEVASKYQHTALSGDHVLWSIISTVNLSKLSSPCLMECNAVNTASSMHSTTE